MRSGGNLPRAPAGRCCRAIGPRGATDADASAHREQPDERDRASWRGESSLAIRQADVAEKDSSGASRS